MERNGSRDEANRSEGERSGWWSGGGGGGSGDKTPKNFKWRKMEMPVNHTEGGKGTANFPRNWLNFVLELEGGLS